jgi:acyl-CoA hydrolase
VSPIRAGSRIYIGTGCAAPHSLLAALETMEPGPADLEFVSFLTTSALPQVEGASRTHYGHRTYFVGSEMRGLAASGQLDYVPISLEEVPRLLHRLCQPDTKRWRSMTSQSLRIHDLDPALLRGQPQRPRNNNHKQHYKNQNFH